MWRILIVGLLLGGGNVLLGDPAPTTGAEIPGTQLTWEDCVRMATRENPDLQASREAVLNTDAVHRGAYSALYPQISASFSDTRKLRWRESGLAQ